MIFRFCTCPFYTLKNMTLEAQKRFLHANRSNHMATMTFQKTPQIFVFFAPWPPILEQKRNFWIQKERFRHDESNGVCPIEIGRAVLEISGGGERNLPPAG